MEETEPKKSPPKTPQWWDVRKSIAELHGLEAAKKYDEYLKEHRIRLKQLESICRG